MTMLISVMGAGVAHSETVLKVTLPKSYESVFKELAENFYKKEGIRVEMTSTCSGKAAKEVKDYGMFIDLVISADYSIIDKLLVDNRFADWNMLFAKNEMVLGYTGKSRYADSVKLSNWYDIMLRNDVKVGLSAADDEPCGYRALMVLALAEKLYKSEGLKDRIVKKALFEKKSDIDIVNDLIEGKVDYILTYKTYAVEKGFKYLTLPKEINLYSARYSEYMEGLEVKPNIDMEVDKVSATCIYYSFTIPSTVQHREEAVKLGEYILSNEAAKVMEKHGFYVVCNPLLRGSASKLDEPLKKSTILANTLK